MKSFQECVDASVRRLTEVRKRVRDLATTTSTRGGEHECSEQSCAPRNERFYCQRGFIAPPVMCENVFLCHYGVVHVCSPQTCTRYLENKQGTCPISGICYGNIYQTDYDKEDSRTWYQKPQTSVVDEQTPRHVVRMKRSRNILMQSGSIFEEGHHPQRERPTPPRGERDSAERPGESTLKEEEEEEAKKPKVKTWKVRPRAQLEQKVKYVLQELLFSPTRKKYNDDITQKHKDAHKKEHDRYMHNCKVTGQFPNLIDLHTIANHYNNLPLPMLNIEMDLVMMNHYVNMIMQVWDTVSKYTDETATKVSIEAVALGTLYTLRQGLLYKGVEMIPKDLFMSQRGVLPIINDIVRFGFTKKTVTCGEKLIDAAYNRAMRMKVCKDEITIDFSKMHEQNQEKETMIPLGQSGKKVYY